MSRAIVGCLWVVTAVGLPVKAVERTWTGKGANAVWGTPANWSPAGTPGNGDSLVFPGGASRPTSTNNLSGLRLHSILFNGTSGGFTLRGTAVKLDNDITDLHQGGPNFVDLDLLPTSTASLIANGPGQLFINGRITIPATQRLLLLSLGSPNLVLSGVIEGPGDLIKIGDGSARLNGLQPNTYSGQTIVKAGELHLSKTGPNRVAVSPSLVIGDDTLTESHLIEETPGQLPTPVQALVSSNGFWTIESSVTVSKLTLIDGSIDGSGTLKLDTDVEVLGSQHDPGSESQILCPVDLGDFTRTFHFARTPVAIGATLVLGGSISGGTSSLLPAGLHFDADFAGSVLLSASNSFAGTVFAESCYVSIFDQSSLGTSHGILPGTIIHNGELFLLGGNSNPALPPVTIEEPLTLVESSLRVDLGASSYEFSGPISMSGQVIVEGPRVGSRPLVMSGPLGGSGFVSFRGSIRLAGAQTNSYQGEVTAEYVGRTVDGVDLPSRLELSRPSGLGPAVKTVTTFGPATIALLADAQLSGLPVRIESLGTLDMGGHVDTLASLTLHNGAAVVGMNRLAVTGQVQVIPADTSFFPSKVAALLDGILSLPGTTRFSVSNVLDGPSLVLHGNIVGPGGFTKDGSGTLRVESAGSYQGSVNVSEGTLEVASESALGNTSGGTTVGQDGSLVLTGGRVLINEPLSLSSVNPMAFASGPGSNTWIGPIVLGGPTGVFVKDQLEILGTISGPGGIDKTGPGTLRFSGSDPNSYQGITRVEEGSIEAGRVGQIAIPGDAVVGLDSPDASSAVLATLRDQQLRPDARLTLLHSGILSVAPPPNLPPPRVTLASVAGTGGAVLGAGASLTISNRSSFAFEGSLSGSGSFLKAGPATLRMAGDSFGFSGTTTVLQGDYRVDGRMDQSPVVVQPGGALRGDGVVGDVVLVGANTEILADPSVPTRSAGDLEVHKLNIGKGGVAALTLFGPAAYGGNDALIADDHVVLDQAQLSTGFRYPAHDGDVLTLIDNRSATPIQGIFSGWAEGQVRQVGGVTVRASYRGGDGNDFTLTVTNNPLALAGTRLAQGNGNQTVEPDECNLLFVSLRNTRARALNITRATLAAVTPGVVVTRADDAFPQIPAGETRESVAGFQFRTDASFPCGAGVVFDLSVDADGEPEIGVALSLPGGSDCGKATGPCESCTLVRGEIRTNSPVSDQLPLLAGVASLCAPPKPCPGPASAVPGVFLPYSLHTLTNATEEARCVTVRLEADPGNAPGVRLGAAAYLGGFNPLDPCVGYLGDTGGEGTSPFSVTVPARSNLVVVVVLAQGTPAPPAAYSMELFGLPCPPPHLEIATEAGAGRARLTWSTSSPGYVPAQAAAVDAAFTPIAQSPTIVHGRYLLTNLPAGPTGFFQLQR